MALTDPLADQYKQRLERASAIQKEQSNEAFAGAWLRVSDIEPILVGVASVCQGIMAGIVDSARASGASRELVADIERIILEAQKQIATQMDPAAIAASRVVEEFESEALHNDEETPLPIAGPKERKATIRKPRGVGKMGRT